MIPLAPSVVLGWFFETCAADVVVVVVVVVVVPVVADVVNVDVHDVAEARG